MTSPSGSEPRTRSLYHALSPVQAVIVALLAVASLLAVQLVTAELGGEVLAAVVVSYIVVGGGLVAYGYRHGGIALVGLGGARTRFAIAGVLIGLGAWYLGLRLVELVKPPGHMEPVEHVLDRTGLLPSLVIVGVLPAFTEELVFRGVLARGLASRLPVAAAVVISALLFCAFHMIPRQMVGVLPLALALGDLAIRADSIVPTMLAHLANNTIVLLAEHDRLGPVDRVPPGALLAIAAVVVGSGVALAATGQA